MGKTFPPPSSLSRHSRIDDMVSSFDRIQDL
jgi:hypothetical protein